MDHRVFTDENGDSVPGGGPTPRRPLALGCHHVGDETDNLAAVTRRWTLGAVSLFIAGITGCFTPPPVETPGTPPASQTVAPRGALGDEATSKENDATMVSSEMGAVHRISGAGPQVPEELRLPGLTQVVLAKICVSDAGVVERVLILKASEPALATSVVNAVKEWRYRPLTIHGGGAAFRFCYVANFEFKVVRDVIGQ